MFSVVGFLFGLVSIGGIIFVIYLTLIALNNSDVSKVNKIRGFRLRLYELYRLHKLKLGLEERKVNVKDLLALEDWFEETKRVSLQSIDREYSEEQKKLDDYLDSLVEEKASSKKK